MNMNRGIFVIITMLLTSLFLKIFSRPKAVIAKIIGKNGSKNLSSLCDYVEINKIEANR